MKRRSTDSFSEVNESLGDRNIVLIGMPGVGKSTVGVLLAKALTREFIDTDLVVQSREGMSLQDIVDTRGVEAFQRCEEQHVLSVAPRRSVIATGGSVVYSEKAMAFLGSNGVTVYLSAPLDLIRERLTNMDSRGIAMAPGQPLEALYAERAPLYGRYADVTVSSEGCTHEELVDRVTGGLAAHLGRH